VPVALAAAEAASRSPIRPPVHPAEIRAAGYWWTCKSTRARRELGWRTRPHEDTVEDTVRWWEERLGDRLRRVPRTQPIPWKLAGAAARTAGAIGGRLIR
jgi:dihydroflavonol-4-reductase